MTTFIARTSKYSIAFYVKITMSNHGIGVEGIHRTAVSYDLVSDKSANRDIHIKLFIKESFNPTFAYYITVNSDTIIAIKTITCHSYFFVPE